MKKLFHIIRNAPKRAAAVVLMLATIVAISTTSNAWGPIRDTYTIKKPADKVALNSITDNPNIGDERNFVGIRKSGTSDKWTDNMKVENGKEYTVRMYVHNNAAANLGLVAEDVTAKFNLPTNTAKSIQVNGFLSTSNMGAKKGTKGKYGEVYDHAVFSSDKNFNVAYVSGSLKYENNAFGAKGTALPESIFTSKGAKLGYNKLDGKIPGCFQYDGYVTFKVKAQVQQTTDFTLKKMVSEHGKNQWTENYDAKPGEKVDFILAYKNTGDVQHDDVTFRDTLPNGLSYVANTTTWGNASGTHKVTTNDGNLTNGTGINVGSYAKGANAYTTFTAKVAEKDKLACGVNKLVNKGKVTTGGYGLEDDASVTVEKECEPEVKKIIVCELETKKIITIDEKDFDSSKHSKDLNDCKESVMIEVCELKTKKIITIKEEDFDSAKHSKDLNDCKETVPGKIVVCDLNTKEIIAINEKDFDSSKHSKNLNDCKKPVEIKVCEPDTGKIVTINKDDFDSAKHSEDLNDCKEVETPVELPRTGPAEALLSMIGLGSIAASATYYVRSRNYIGR